MVPPLSRRIFLARLELTYRVGHRVTLAEFGRLVAKHMGRARPFTGATVSRWESGAREPSSEVLEAAAALAAPAGRRASAANETDLPPAQRSGERERSRNDAVKNGLPPKRERDGP